MMVTKRRSKNMEIKNQNTEKCQKQIQLFPQDFKSLVSLMGIGDDVDDINIWKNFRKSLISFSNFERKFHLHTPFDRHLRLSSS